MSDAQKYTQRWRFVFDPMSLETIDDLISTLEAFADALPALREWRALGVQLDPAEADENVADGYRLLHHGRGRGAEARFRYGVR